MSNFTFNYCHNFILFARSNKQQWESQNNLETPIQALWNVQINT